MKKFSKNLRKLMAKSKLTQVELAKRSGIKQQSISRYLNEDPQGKRPRDIEAVLALCKALDCSLYDLTGLRGLREGKSIIGNSRLLTEDALQLASLFDELEPTDPLRKKIKHLLGLK